MVFSDSIFDKAKQNKLFVFSNPPVPKKRCRVSKFYSFLVENKVFIDIPCLLFDRRFSETVMYSFYFNVEKANILVYILFN